MQAVADSAEDFAPAEAEVRRRLLLRRPDWFMALILLVVALPNDVLEWFTVPRWPSGWEWGLLAIMALLCTANPWALLKRTPVMVLKPEGFALPDYYEDIVPWDAVKMLERNGQTIRMTIAEGQRFGRKRILYYRMFPEQARYKKDDFQVVDCNRCDWSARDLLAFMERHVGAANGSTA